MKISHANQLIIDLQISTQSPSGLGVVTLPLLPVWGLLHYHPFRSGGCYTTTPALSTLCSGDSRKKFPACCQLIGNVLLEEDVIVQFGFNVSIGVIRISFKVVWAEEVDHPRM